MDLGTQSSIVNSDEDASHCSAIGSNVQQSNYFLELDNDQECGEHSLICEIKDEICGSAGVPEEQTVCQQEPINEQRKLSRSEESLLVSSTSKALSEDEELDYMHSNNWREKKKHIFVLSEAGKPIFSQHGKEEKLATLFGIIQALVMFVQHGQDALTSIHANNIKFVFLIRNSLILVAASRTNMSVPQLQMQLSDVYNQILLTLTYSHMNKIFEKRKNFDLRRLLVGSERLMRHLDPSDGSKKNISNNIFTFLTNSIRVLPLATSVRANIVNTIQCYCSKIKNLVFAVLIANNKLITLVRMKKYSIHPADLRLIFNLIECSESFKTSENWTPICLPKFDMNGYLHAHVSYLSEDCQACLMLLSVDRDVFFTLSAAKKLITEKLLNLHCLEAIKEGMNKCVELESSGIPDLRHFLYKPKATAQLLCSELVPPYTAMQDFKRLQAIYCELLDRVHSNFYPLKLIYKASEHEVVLAWVTAAYELYAVFEPMVDKSSVIKYVDKLIKWIEKEYDVFFIRNHPTF